MGSLPSPDGILGISGYIWRKGRSREGTRRIGGVRGGGDGHGADISEEVRAVSQAGMAWRGFRKLVMR